MDYLTRKLLSLAKIPDFNCHLRYENFSLTDVIFTDDLLLFVKGDSMSIQMLLSASIILPKFLA